MKTCPCCKILKDRHEFSANKSRVDGLYTYCKECTADKLNAPRDVSAVADMVALHPHLKNKIPMLKNLCVGDAYRVGGVVILRIPDYATVNGKFTPRYVRVENGTLKRVSDSLVLASILLHLIDSPEVGEILIDYEWGYTCTSA